MGYAQHHLLHATRVQHGDRSLFAICLLRARRTNGGLVYERQRQGTPAESIRVRLGSDIRHEISPR